LSLQFIVCLRITFAALLIPAIQKQIAGLPGKVNRIWWQYAFTALISSILIFLNHESIFHTVAIIAFVVGIANGIAYYSYLCAIDISQSKSAVFSPFTHMIAILLAVFFLDEWKLLTPMTCVGLLLTMIGAFLISSKKLDSTQAGNRKETYRFLRLVAVYTVIWGIALFCMKAFSSYGLSKLSFVFWWYLGSFIGASIIKIALKDKSSVISIGGICWMFFLAFLLVINMFFTYWAYELAPMVLIQPVFQISNILGLLIVGLFFFRERNSLCRREWCGIGYGSCGAIIVALALLQS